MSKTQTNTSTPATPGKITIEGKSYPLIITMGAFLDFKSRTGREASQIDSSNISDTIVFIFCVAKATARRQGTEFPYDSPESMADCLTPDELASVQM